MRKTNLEIIKLNNSDVIATSCQCDRYMLLRVILDDETPDYRIFENGGNNKISGDEAKEFLKNEGSYTSTGYYHVDSNGYIVGVCDCYDGIDASSARESHNLGSK